MHESTRRPCTRAGRSAPSFRPEPHGADCPRHRLTLGPDGFRCRYCGERWAPPGRGEPPSRGG